MDDCEIYNHGDEDPEEYGWYITWYGNEFSHPINYCPLCGMELQRVEWIDLR